MLGILEKINSKLLKKNIWIFFLLIINILIFTITNQQFVAADSYYPLVVYGGSPEGVMAAVAASREGTNTLLIMKREKPGGLMTYGGLNYLDINQGPNKENLNKGIFAEWHQQVGGKVTFSIRKAIEVFEEMLAREDKLKVYRNTDLINLKKNENKIKEIVIDRGYGREIILSDFVIDASQDADLAVKANSPYFTGGADIGLKERHMAVTLVLHIGNVDWAKLVNDARQNKFGPSHINKNHAWGFVKIGQLYQPVNKNTKMRGLNIVIENRGKNSEVYINSLLIFGVNPVDELSLKQAYITGKNEAKHIIDFLRNNLSGFSGAELLDFPQELYVRESRHIISRYQLKVDDLFENRIFKDTIALASYPLDYQASTPYYDGFVLFNPSIYGIPLRSIIPRGFNNLMVVGRSSGYSSLAAASVRVLPAGMASAEAAGRIVTYMLKNQFSIEDILNSPEIIKEIQYKLQIRKIIKKYSLTLANQSIIDIDKDNPVYSHLKKLLSWGLVVGGYHNDFKLGDYITEKEFAHLIVKGLQQRQAPILYEWVPGGLETMSSDDLLTRDQAAMLLLVAISKRISEIKEKEYYPTVIELGLIPNFIKKNIKKNRLLTRSEVYIILSNFLQKYPPPVKIKVYRGER